MCVYKCVGVYIYLYKCVVCVYMCVYVCVCAFMHEGKQHTQSTCTSLSHLQWPVSCLVVVYSTMPCAETTCIRDVSGIHVLWPAVCLKDFPVVQNNNTLSPFELHNCLTKLTAAFILIFHSLM